MVGADSGIFNTGGGLVVFCLFFPQTRDRQISNRSKRSKVASDWENGTGNKTAWNFVFALNLKMHSL